MYLDKNIIYLYVHNIYTLGVEVKLYYYYFVTIFLNKYKIHHSEIINK